MKPECQHTRPFPTGTVCVSCGRAEGEHVTLSQRAPALFVPLKTEFFEAFEAGKKREELRCYGPRWNEQTCPIGRGVVLSRGYGKQARLRGRVARFKRQHGSTFGSTYRASIERLYGTLDVWIACISIDLHREESHV